MAPVGPAAGVRSGVRRAGPPVRRRKRRRESLRDRTAAGLWRPALITGPAALPGGSCDSAAAPGVSVGNAAPPGVPPVSSERWWGGTNTIVIMCCMCCSVCLPLSRRQVAAGNGESSSLDLEKERKKHCVRCYSSWTVFLLIIRYCLSKCTLVKAEGESKVLRKTLCSNVELCIKTKKRGNCFH